MNLILITSMFGIITSMNSRASPQVTPGPGAEEAPVFRDFLLVCNISFILTIMTLAVSPCFVYSAMQEAKTIMTLSSMMTRLSIAIIATTVVDVAGVARIVCCDFGFRCRLCLPSVGFASVEVSGSHDPVETSSKFTNASGGWGAVTICSIDR